MPPTPYRVIFVCMGNICRSPMAESVLRAQLGQAGLADRVVVDSAGTGGWHVGDPADRRAVAALASRGYPTAHTARAFEPRWLAERDLVVAMDAANRSALVAMAPDRESTERVRLLREFDPDAAGYDLDVPDPYYGTARDFVGVLDMVEAGCAGITAHLAATLTVRTG